MDQPVKEVILPPNGMIVVSESEFFRLLYRDKRDIMPRNTRPESTDWETKDRYKWGWASPGWLKKPGQPKIYAVSSEVIRLLCA